MKSSELLEKIVSMECFAAALADARAADPVNGANIEAALNACLAPVHDDLRLHGDQPDVVRLLLYREGVELKAHTAAYLTYERELATREAALLRFALGATDQFFTLVFDALDDYFSAKTDVIINEVEKNSDWYTGLTDTAKKSGELVNLGVNGLKKLARVIGDYGPSSEIARTAARTIEELPDETVKTQDVVQKAIEKHLGREVLRDDVRKILQEAAERYEQAWLAEIKAQTPDLRALRAFSPSSSSMADAFPGFNIGLAEQTLAVGLGGAVLGTMSLAAGWHTMAYAMVHVFYPAAIAVALAAAGIAWLRKEKDLEHRRAKVRNAVDQYHRYFLLEIDTGKRRELGGVTLRDALANQAKELIAKTAREWEHAISGNLTTSHYQKVSEAAVNHLLLVQQCLEALDAETGHPPKTTPAAEDDSRSSFA